MIRLKLMPPLSIAMISLCPASFDVKKITEIKTNSGENMFMKYGMKFM